MIIPIPYDSPLKRSGAPSATAVVSTPGIVLQDGTMADRTEQLATDATDRASSIVGIATYIIKDNPATFNGKLTTVRIFAAVAGTTKVKFKIFRDDGTNFVMIGSTTTYTVVQGLNTLTLTDPIDGVHIGDLFAITLTNATTPEIDYATTGGKLGVSYKTGDVTGSSAKTGWTSNADWIISANGTNAGGGAHDISIENIDEDIVFRDRNKRSKSTKFRFNRSLGGFGILDQICTGDYRQVIKHTMPCPCISDTQEFSDAL
ncbi:MAG: hypothetical protein V1709_11660, partial [Planctomycetota bacterium]